MKIKISVITCSDPNSKCSFNPERKSICPVSTGHKGAIVVCNCMRTEEVVCNIRGDE